MPRLVFFIRPKFISQVSTTQQSPHIKTFKHNAMNYKLNNSVRDHAALIPGLAVAATDPAEIRE